MVALYAANRKTYYVNPGTNAWYLGHLTSNADVNQAMSQIAAVCSLLTRTLDVILIEDSLDSRQRVSGASGRPTTLPQKPTSTIKC